MNSWIFTKFGKNSCKFYLFVLMWEWEDLPDLKISIKESWILLGLEHWSLAPGRKRITPVTKYTSLTFFAEIKHQVKCHICVFIPQQTLKGHFFFFL